MGLFWAKYARRIFAIVSTTSIPDLAPVSPTESLTEYTIGPFGRSTAGKERPGAAAPRGGGSFALGPAPPARPSPSTRHLTFLPLIAWSRRDISPWAYFRGPLLGDSGLSFGVAALDVGRLRFYLATAGGGHPA